MNKKLIFFNQSLENNVLNIAFEVLNYIDKQNRSSMISPDFYDGILLLISEALPYLDKEKRWIDLGYQICQHRKQMLESYGCLHRISMFGGLGSQCFSTNLFSRETGILNTFASSYNKLLFLEVDKKLQALENSPVADSNHDMISGISGVLYYLLDLDSDYTQDEYLILIRCIKYLLRLSHDTSFNGKSIIKFHVHQPYQNPNFGQKEFKNGNINFGLAHGMLGPLIAMSKAYKKGFRVQGLLDGINKIYHLYKKFQIRNKNNIPYWPGPMSVEEYWAGTCRPEHLHISSSWCYGNIGILRGLQKVAGYMGWKKDELEYINIMKNFLCQSITSYDLYSPSLCHGFSSIVAIQSCSYFVYNDQDLLVNLERNVWKIITEYRKSNDHEINLMEILSRSNLTEGYLKDLSLLTGSVGVAIALLSVNNFMKSSKLFMID